MNFLILERCAVIINACRALYVWGELHLNRKIDDFLAAAERMKLGDYVRFESDRRRRLMDAFLQGIMRGIGALIGFAVLGAVLVYLLQRIADKSLPWISSFVAEIVRLVQLRVN